MQAPRTEVFRICCGDSALSGTPVRCRQRGDLTLQPLLVLLQPLGANTSLRLLNLVYLALVIGEALIVALPTRSSSAPGTCASRNSFKDAICRRLS